MRLNRSLTTVRLRSEAFSDESVQLFGVPNLEPDLRFTLLFAPVTRVLRNY